MWPFMLFSCFLWQRRGFLRCSVWSMNEGLHYPPHMLPRSVGTFFRVWCVAIQSSEIYRCGDYGGGLTVQGRYSRFERAYRCSEGTMLSEHPFYPSLTVPTGEVAQGAREGRKRRR